MNDHLCLWVLITLPSSVKPRQFLPPARLHRETRRKKVSYFRTSSEKASAVRLQVLITPLLSQAMEVPPSSTAAAAATGEGGTAGAALDQELVDLLYHELIDPSDERKTSQGESQEPGLSPLF